MHFHTDEEQRALLMLTPEHAQGAVEHAQTLDEAATVMLHRTSSYGLVWRRHGAIRNLLKSADKVARLMEVWYEGHDVVDLVGDDGQIVRRIPALHKDGLDDAIDAINYLAFFIQCARQGNITGEPLVAQAMNEERDRLVTEIRGVATSIGHADEEALANHLDKIADRLAVLDD